MKKILVYALGITLTMSVATASFAGNGDNKDGNKKECTSKKECTNKDKKACAGKCTGKKDCCKSKN